MNKKITQVSDDPALLEMMMQDMKLAPEIYQPTNYWSLFINEYLPKLLVNGLHDFRRSNDPSLARFIQQDNVPPMAEIELHKIRLLHNRFTIKIPYYQKALAAFSRFLTRHIPVRTAYGLQPQNIWRLSFSHTNALASGTKAPPITSVRPSLCGNPEALFEVDGISYPFSFYLYYLRYAYCTRFFDFNGAKTIVELGSGGGQQAEVIRLFHPEATILLFDIPPQLYVCEQFLKTAFPEQVTSYQDNKNATDLKSLESGKIHMLGAWQMPLLATFPHDLFHSCLSLAEMEPHVVRNYLGFVNQSAENVYLAQYFHGKAPAKRQGLPGVMKSTVFQDYADSLSDFEMLDRSMADWHLDQGKAGKGNEQTFWKRR